MVEIHRPGADESRGLPLSALVIEHVNEEIVIMVGIADNTVLVTGGNRGIGRALVEEALSRRAKRVYVGTRTALAHPDDRVMPLTLDVTNAAHIQQAVDEVESLDVLVNNAGVSLYDDLSDRSALERHLAVNLIGVYGMVQAFLPSLTRRRSHRQQPVGERAGSLAAHSRLLGLEGRCVQPDPIAARPTGWTGRDRPRRSDRPRGHGHDPRPRHTEKLPRILGASHF